MGWVLGIGEGKDVRYGYIFIDEVVGKYGLVWWDMVDDR